MNSEKICKVFAFALILVGGAVIPVRLWPAGQVGRVGPV